MALVQLNLNVDAGAVFPQADGPMQFVWTNADGSLYDLTGYTAKFQIRKDPSDVSAVVTVTPSINVATATISFSITAAQTAVLTDGPYKWALEVYAPSSGPTYRLAEGLVIASPEVVK